MSMLAQQQKHHKEIIMKKKPIAMGYGGKVKKKKSGGDFPDLNKDGKVSYADVLEGRGVTKKKSGGMCRGMGRATQGGNYGRMG